MNIKTIEVPCIVCESNTYDLICNTRDFCYETCENEFHYVKCLKCDQIYLKNRPILNELTTIYPSNYLTYAYKEQLGGLIYSIRNWVQRSKIKPIIKYAKKDDIIVDVGCGAGDFLSLVKRYGDKSWDLCGIDFSAEAIKVLNERSIRGINGRFEEIQWKGNHVGAIVMLQLIEHVENPTAILKKCFEILRPGGVVIMETPSLEGLDGKIFYKRYWGGWHAPRHWSIFTEKTLGNLVKSVGFSITEVNYVLNPFGWLHSIQYLLKEKSRFKTFAHFFDVNHLLALALAVGIDRTQMILTGKSSNMQFIAQKPWK
jgi:2-polyprenyl-3-methyl-5-hydroxy-6-metoxy-1,4-benzoquinol methylase